MLVLIQHSQAVQIFHLQRTLSVLGFFFIHFGDPILSRTSGEKLSTFMSTPLSTSTVTNEYINSINSEFNYQLAEMTLFQFPNSDKCKFFILIISIFQLTWWQVNINHETFDLYREISRTPFNLKASTYSLYQLNRDAWRS